MTVSRRYGAPVLLSSAAYSVPGRRTDAFVGITP